MIGAHWGLYGLCIGGAVAYPLQFLFLVKRISVVRRGCFWLLLRPLLRPALAALLMYVVVRAVSWGLPASFSTPARLGVLIGTGVVVYPASAYLDLPGHHGGSHLLARAGSLASTGPATRWIAQRVIERRQLLPRAGSGGGRVRKGADFARREWLHSGHDVFVSWQA